MSGIDLLAVLDRQIQREYNPFEPDNQSEDYPRLIEAREAANGLLAALQSMEGMIEEASKWLHDSSLWDCEEGPDGDGTVMDYLLSGARAAIAKAAGPA